MSALAVLLAAVGLADLLPRWRLPAALVLTVAGLLALGAGWHALWLTVLVMLVVAVWLETAARRSGVAIGLLATSVAGLLVASAGLDFRTVPLQGWYDALPVPGLATVPIDRAALALGVLLFLTTAANVVVRHALTAAGPLVLEQERTLKGGRLLGPLERWLVFGFAVGGHVGALAALVAAKGILRFPEISRDRPDGLRAEYVLLGSFVSWTIALAPVVLF